MAPTMAPRQFAKKRKNVLQQVKAATEAAPTTEADGRASCHYSHYHHHMV